MEDSVLMQQDLRATLLEEDQMDHSMLGDHQETPMEDGLTEEQDREMVTMEADRHPMLSEQADLSAVVLVLVLVSADLPPLMDSLDSPPVLIRRAGEGSSSARE